MLVIDFDDGTQQKIVSNNETFFTAAGPVTMDSLYLGETYDARLEQDKWAEASFDKADWAHAVRVDGPSRATLSALSQPPVRVSQVLPCVKLTSPSAGVYVFDFGQNFAGVGRLRVTGPKGQTVTLRYAEIMNDTHNGEISQGNLRAAISTDHYTLKGDPKGEVYTPFFAQHGFRFVEVQH